MVKIELGGVLLPGLRNSPDEHVELGDVGEKRKGEAAYHKDADLPAHGPCQTRIHFGQGK